MSCELWIRDCSSVRGKLSEANYGLGSAGRHFRTPEGVLQVITPCKAVAAARGGKTPHIPSELRKEFNFILFWLCSYGALVVERSRNHPALRLRLARGYHLWHTFRCAASNKAQPIISTKRSAMRNPEQSKIKNIKSLNL